MFELNLGKQVQNFRFSRAWSKRNLVHGEVMMTALELDYIPFQQNLFVQYSSDLVEKLERIGFSKLNGYPDESEYKTFSSVLYNDKHNVAVHLYSPEYSYALHTATEIVNSTIQESMTAHTVFFGTIKVLLTKIDGTSRVKSKQAIAG